MASRPKLSLELRAEIERKRKALFDSAAQRFPILFPPVSPPMTLAIYGVDQYFKSPEIMARLTAPRPQLPKQRMTATTLVQLQDYAGALFDIEAIHYCSIGGGLIDVSLWLGEIKASVQAEVWNKVTDTSLDVHCTLEERAQAIDDGLKDRVSFWCKQRATPLLPPPLKRLHYSDHPTGLIPSNNTKQIPIGTIKPTATPLRSPDITPSRPLPDDPAFPNRASWLKERLRERGKWSPYKLKAKGGPDAKTTKKILKGEFVRESRLDLVITGLNTKVIGGRTLTSDDVPSD